MAYNIMIVDDSATVRAVLAKTLRLTGIEIGELREAANGKQALEYLRNGWFDLIFTDINMPEMNGLELIDAVTSDEVMGETPIVVISTDGSTSRVEEIKSKGVRAYVRKPFTPECVRDVVSGVLLGEVVPEENTL